VQTHLRGRDLITTQEWTKDELDTVLDVALDLKRRRALGEPHALLRDKVLAMLFFFSSTRTRASFEAAMAQLGGHAQFIESKSTQIAHGDTATEIGEILGRYNDGWRSARSTGRSATATSVTSRPRPGCRSTTCSATATTRSRPSPTSSRSSNGTATRAASRST
jgi:ornithine carbamoyltransferase